MAGTLVLVTYYGIDREPIRTAVDHLEGWEVVDCPLYKWRVDENERRTDYLEAAAEVITDANADVVLFWYHGVTVVELRYLRERVPERVQFALFTWDDPFDWHSPFLNMREMQHYFADGGVLTCCAESAASAYAVPATYCAPGYIERLAAEVVGQHHGEERFECDVCFMCTNLYADMDIYSRQRVPRKDLVDALYAQEDIVFHLYGPESFRDAYPRAYRGFVPFEETYRIMRTSRVCVSTHVVGVGVTQYLNERTAIAMGCGALLVTDIVPQGSAAIDLGSSVDEAVQTIRKAAQMPYGEAESVRDQLRAYARNALTWKHWATTVKTHLLEQQQQVAQKKEDEEQQQRQQQQRSVDNNPSLPSGDGGGGGERISELRVKRQVFLQPIVSEAADPCHGVWIFDFAVSIGTWCAVAHHLRERRLRFEAFPFDWTFSNLAAVTASVPEDGALTVLNEFLTPPQYRTHYEGVDVHQQIGYPHHNPNTLDGIRYMRRACERWRRLLHAQPGHTRSVLFLHTARPVERVDTVRTAIRRFVQTVQQHCPHIDAHVVSIWNQVWNPKDPAEDYMNRLMCVERTQDYTILLAHVSSEWDGDDWAGTQHGALWDQVFQTFRVQREDNYVPTTAFADEA